MKRLPLLLVLLALCVGPVAAQPRETALAWFESISEELQTHVDGPLALWQVDGGPLYEQGVTDLFLTERLAFAVELALNAGSGSYVYDEGALGSDIEMEAAIGALRPGRVRPEQALSSLRGHGPNGVRYLLEVEVVASAGRDVCLYWVIDLRDGSLRWAGALDENGQVSVSPPAEMTNIARGASGMILPVAMVSSSPASGDLDRELETIGLARALPGKVLSMRHFRANLFASLDSDERIAIVMDGARYVPESMRNEMLQLNVTLAMYVENRGGSRILTLLDPDTGVLAYQAVTGGRAGRIAEQLSAMSGAEVRQDTGRIGSVHVEPIRTSGVQALGSDEHDAGRAAIQSWLSANGLDVVDFQFMASVDSAVSRLGLESFVRPTLDAAGLHLMAVNYGSNQVAGVYTSMEDNRLSSFIARTVNEFLSDAAPDLRDAAAILGAPVESAFGSDQPSQPAIKLFLADHLYRRFELLDPAISSERLGAIGVHDQSAPYDRRDAEALQNAETLPPLLVRLVEVSALGGSDLHIQFVNRQTGVIEVSRGLQLSEEITRDVARELAPQLGTLGRDRLVLISSAHGAAPNQYPSAMRTRLDSLFSEELGWQTLLATAGWNDESVGSYLPGGARSGATVVTPIVWAPTVNDLALFVRVVDTSNNTILGVPTAYLDDQGQGLSNIPLDDAAGAVLDRIRAITPSRSTVKIFRPDQPLAGLDPVVLGALSARDLIRNGRTVRDTPFPSSAEEFDSQNVIFMLNSSQFVYLHGYDDGSVVIRRYDRSGKIDALSLPEGSTPTALALRDRLPEFPRFRGVDVVVDDTTLIQVPNEVVHDLVLEKLIQTGSSDISDRLNAATFLAGSSSPANTAFVGLASTPLLGSSNGTVMTLVTQGDSQVVFAHEAPVLFPVPTLRPGEYVRVDLDAIASLLTSTIANEYERSGRPADPVAIIQPDAIVLDAEPNRILRERYGNPVQIIVTKSAAQLFAVSPDFTVYTDSARAPETENLYRVTASVHSAGETLDEQRMSYTQVFSGVGYVHLSEGRRVPVALEPEGQVPEIELTEMRRALELQALATADASILQAATYAEAGDATRLRDELLSLEETLKGIRELRAEVPAREEAIGLLQQRLEGLKGEGELNLALNEAAELIAAEDYRQARRVLNEAERKYGESEDIDRLLFDADNLSRGVIGVVRHPDGQSFQPAEFGTLPWDEFSVEGNMTGEATQHYVNLQFRNTGVYRLDDLSKNTLVTIDEDHSLTTEDGRYIVVESRENPVALRIQTDLEHPEEFSWSLTLVKDNDTVYRVSEDQAALDALFAPLAVPSDVESYHTRVRRLRTGTGMLATGIVSAGVGVGMWALNEFVLQDQLAEAIAQYQAATTTPDATYWGDRATSLRSQSLIVRVMNGAGYGLAGAGVVTGILLYLSLPPRSDLNDAVNLF